MVNGSLGPCPVCPPYRKKRLAQSSNTDAMPAKKAMKEAAPGRLIQGFYSHIFLVHKNPGARRPVIDQSVFNKFVVSPHL